MPIISQIRSAHAHGISVPPEFEEPEVEALLVRTSPYPENSGAVELSYQEEGIITEWFGGCKFNFCLLIPVLVLPLPTPCGSVYCFFPMQISHLCIADWLQDSYSANLYVRCRGKRTSDLEIP